jgi:hypothetical protein
LHCLQKMRPLAQQGLIDRSCTSKCDQDRQATRGRWVATGRPKRALTSLLYYRNIAVHAGRSTGPGKERHCNASPAKQTALRGPLPQPRVSHPVAYKSLATAAPSRPQHIKTGQKYSWPQHSPSSASAKHTGPAALTSTCCSVLPSGASPAYSRSKHAHGTTAAVWHNKTRRQRGRTQYC